MKTSKHKMTAETLDALKGSIKKWEGIVAGTGSDKGKDNCPLCQLFFEYGCMECPVYMKTGISYCEITPYTKWEDHQYKYHPRIFSSMVHCPKCLKLAKAELEFLKSLLPKS